MSQQPSNNQQPPQPNPQTVITIQKQEIDRLNDNRVYLIALLEDTQKEGQAEIERQHDEVARLMGVVSQLKGMLNEDVLEEAETIIGKVSGPTQ